MAATESLIEVEKFAPEMIEVTTESYPSTFSSLVTCI